jgi:hypothetical protein
LTIVLVRWWLLYLPSFQLIGAQIMVMLLAEVSQ